MSRRPVARGELVLIARAASQAGLHPQTIRIYEQAGLVNPQRSGGGTRMYGPREVDRIRLIASLTGELGLNLAGVSRVLELQQQLDKTRLEADRQRRMFERREAAHINEIHRLRSALSLVSRALSRLQLPAGR